MKLDSFRVRNYRSINDSGDISVSRITALLGRNESGKSNLLRALYSLNPVEGFKALSPIKDFPRHRRLEECTLLAAGPHFEHMEAVGLIGETHVSCPIHAAEGYLST